MSDDHRILDAAQVRAQCHRVLNGGKPFREEAVSELLDSHEALRAALATKTELVGDWMIEYGRVMRERDECRAALATAEAERDSWKAYAARVAQEARDNFGVAEAAEELVSTVERVAVLLEDVRAVESILEAAAAAARAVLAVPEGDAE